MPDFGTPASLFRYITEVTLEEMARDIEEAAEVELTEQLLDTVYANTSGGQYDNTFSLLSAVDTQVVRSGGLEREIEVDTNINPSKIENPYPSYYTGNEDNRRYIVGWLNDGHGGYYMKRPVNYPAQQFIEKGQKKINKEMKQKLVKRMKQRGYKFGYTTALDE